jgi:DNA-binding NarL/FixJ family response regulator
MDLTSNLEALGPARVNLVLEALLSSDLRLKILMVTANRLGLIVSAMRLKARRLLIGAMTTEEEALPYLIGGLPGILVCSDRLDGGDGYSLARQARQLVPDIRIIMFLEEASPDVAKAIRSNVDAIICADDLGDPSQPVSRGLLAIANHQTYLSPTAKALLKQQSPANPINTIKLTDRQDEILSMLLNGDTEILIADKLGISLTTVKDHTKVLRSKFGVKNKVALVMRAMQLAISR